MSRPSYRMDSDFDEIIECASLEGYLIPYEVFKI